MEEILSVGRKLYSGEVSARYTIEMLAKDSGVDIKILKGLDEGIEMYIHPLKHKSPVEIAEHLKADYNIDPKSTYCVILDLTKRGLEAYRMYRSRKVHSKRIAGNYSGLDGFVFEDFFWTQHMSDAETKTKPECEAKLEQLIEAIRKLAA